jgi:Zn-dependent protease
MENVLAKISIMLIPALLAVMAHEVSHGLAAQRLGDPTARLLGRLTLNPFKHLDPIGTLAVLFFGFGWAKPVPVNVQNLNSPKRDMILVSSAGPLANIILAFLSAFLLRGIAFFSTCFSAQNQILFMVLEPLALMAAFSLFINVVLAVLNLLPIPPLDGGRILTGLLPSRQAGVLSRLQPLGIPIVIVLLLFTDFWPRILIPFVYKVVGILAGTHMSIVERVIHFLFLQS